MIRDGIIESVAANSIPPTGATIYDLEGKTVHAGFIEVGKKTNLIITTGNPLEITTNTLTAFINGKPVDLNSKHKSLNNKFKQRYHQK